MKRAFITGITGQDGSYLTELLLEKSCEVHGIIRRAGRVLGWKPEVDYEQLVKLMTDGGIRLLDNPQYEIGF